MRTVARMLMPSTSAATTWTCFSFGNRFILTIMLSILIRSKSNLYDIDLFEPHRTRLPTLTARRIYLVCSGYADDFTKIRDNNTIDQSERRVQRNLLIFH